MRRAAPPQLMRVDPADPGPWARVAAGPRGLGLVAAPAPPGGVADTAVLRPARGVPFATVDAAIVNEGAIALTVAPGVARTLRLHDLAALFDRRPPGLADAVGAPSANAALLRDDAGWRAVVLPSMGDLVADLGPGPVAMRADGRRVAVAHESAVFEVEIPGAATTSHSDGGAEALAYAAGGSLLVARDGGLGAAAAGSPITRLVAAAAAPRAASVHEDGRVRVWDTGSLEIVAEWEAPGAPLRVALNPEGTALSLAWADGDAQVAAVVRAEDGVQVRRIEGANVIAFDPAGRGILVGGDWGALWLEPPREVS